MKINFNKIIQFIKKHKVMVLFIVLIIILLFYSSSSIVEGFDNNIGEYDYLAPPRSPIVINNDTWKRLATKYIIGIRRMRNPLEVGKIITDQQLNRVINNLKRFVNDLTKPEVDYYLKNGKFPYNNYVMEYLQKFKNEIDFFQLTRPNRQIYKEMIYPKESKQTPLPLSAKIYLGQQSYSELISVCKQIYSSSPMAEYDYLEPPASPTIITDDTWKKIAMRFINDNRERRKTLVDVGKKITDRMIEQAIRDLKPYISGNDITQPEIDHYLKYGIFPYNNYILNYLSTKLNLTKINNMGGYQNIMPNRRVYKNIIYPSESQQTPLPISAKIYLGQQSYSELVSVCKKINGGKLEKEI